MALTRAQLLSGNSSQGTVLPGQVQGVSQGIGVTINASGQISVDASTVTGLVKLNNLGAYNAYVWPNVDGTANQFLQTDGSGNLSWTSAAGFGVVTVSGTAPASPDIGELWFDCSIAQLKVYQNCIGTPSPNWFSISQPGLPVLPANVSATPAFGSGTGVVADPYILAAVNVPSGATSYLINTVTVTGLAPNQYVPIVDLNTGTNLNRFLFSNYYANASGTLVFQIIYRDLPNSAPGASYTADIRIGYASAYLRGTVSITPSLSLSSGTITGTPASGAPVNYTPGVAAGGKSPYAYTYQWYADGALISGATSTSYTPPAGDVGKILSVTQRVTDALNYSVSSTATAATATVAGAIPGWNPTGSMADIPGGLSGNYTGTGTTITATGCIEASINGGAYGAGGPISSGQTLAIRWASTAGCGGAASGTAITGSVTDGIGTNSYSITVNRIPSPAIQDISTFNVSLNGTVSKGTDSTIQGLNTTAYVTYVGTSTGANIQAATLPGGPFTSLATSGTGFPITNGQTLYIQQTAGASVNTGYTAIIRVGDGTNTAGTYDEFTYTATTVATAAFPNSSFTPAGGPNASPASVSIAGENLYGTATCSSWADGSTTLSSTGSLQFRVGAGSFGTSGTPVVDGNTVDLIWDPAAIAAAADGAALTGTLTNGTYTNTYTITIDRAVSGFTFPDLTSQALSTAVTSSVETPNGYNVPVSLTFSGTATNPLTSLGVSVDGGAFGSSPQTVNPGQTVQVRGTTGASASTSYGVNLSMGSGPAATDTWVAATTAAVPTISTPSITSPANGATNIGTPTGATLIGSAYTPLNGAGATQTSSLWEVYKGSFPLTSTNTVTATSSSAAGPWVGANANTGGATVDLYTGAYNGGKFMLAGDVIANGNLSLFYSTDNGLTWTNDTSNPGGGSCFCLVYSNGVWMRGGTSGNLSVSTNNGATWTLTNPISPTAGSTFEQNSIATSGGNTWMAACGALANKIGKSTNNGATWTPISLSAATANMRPSTVAYGGGIWVVGGQDAANAPIFNYSTDDGTSWSVLTLTSLPASGMPSVTYGNGRFVCTIGNSTNTWTSTDGINWTANTGVKSAVATAGVYFGGGYFVSTVNGSNSPPASYLWSTDGVTWYPETAPGTNNTTGVVYGNGKWVSMGDNLIDGGASKIWTGNSLTSSTTLTIAGCQTDGFLVNDSVTDGGSAAGVITSVNNTTVVVAPSDTDWGIGDSLVRASSMYTAVTGSPFTVSSAPFTSLAIAKPPLEANTTYYARVQYDTTNATAATSSYSAWSGFTTGSLAAGTNWTQAATQPTSMSTGAFIYAVGNNVVVGGGGNTNYGGSSDGGVTWSMANLGMGVLSGGQAPGSGTPGIVAHWFSGSDRVWDGSIFTTVGAPQQFTGSDWLWCTRESSSSGIILAGDNVNAASLKYSNNSGATWFTFSPGTWGTGASYHPYIVYCSPSNKYVGVAYNTTSTSMASAVWPGFGAGTPAAVSSTTIAALAGATYPSAVTPVPNGDIILAAGNNGTLAITTNAGTSWSAVTNPFGTGAANKITALAYGAGSYIAGASGGRLAVSTDGTTWSTLTPLAGGNEIRSITRATSYFLLVDATGVVYTSP